MCGLAGFIDFQRNSGQEVLERMTETLKHRGPDGTGCDLIDTDTARIGFGHKRLSILDLSELGRQPMYTEDGQHAIIFNGEVYNFKEVRDWLRSRGHEFRSESDTEVILRALIEEGVSAVNRFTGMFAMAFYDGRHQKVWLIRDRVGVKPLYYANLGNTLLFGSQLSVFHEHPAFNKEMDMAAVGQFLDFGYIKKERSIFKAVKKVLPGHALEIDLQTREVKQTEYWSIRESFQQPHLNISFDEAAEQMEALLIDAFKLRMVSDVPVGVFMSGGIDSTTVAGILQKHFGQISTFTIGFDDKQYNEADKAKDIAKYLGTDHHELYCSEKELLEIFPRLPQIYDEPFSDKSAIPSVLVSEFARSRVTVALSADGGDEVFAGYNKYFKTLELLETLKRKPGLSAKKALYGAVYNNLGGLLGVQNKLYAKANAEYRFLGAYPDPVSMMVAGARTFGPQDLKKILRHDSPTQEDSKNWKLGADNLSRLQSYDYLDYLPDDILVKMDRASMSISLESREPLLDHRIAEFAARLPTEYKYQNGITKRLLRHINHKYVKPELVEGEKKGFAVPKKKWLDTHLKNFVLDYLDETRIVKDGVFDHRYTNGLLSAYKQGGGHNRIWNVLIFNMWYEQWMS